MKALLLNSPWINNEKEYGIKSGTRWAAIRKKDRTMPYFPFPYFMACATSLLRKAGFDAHIKDAIAEGITRDECIRYIEMLKPHLVVIEAFTPSIYFDLAFAKEAKEKGGSLIALCGAHPTVLASEILRNSFIDFVVLREYDYTLKELCQFLSEDRQDFNKIQGLAYKEDGSIKVNPIRPPIADLDEIPFPDREEMPVYKYNEPLSKYYPNAKVVTTRGCPYKCIFCIEPLMCGRRYRKRSVGHVIKEIEMLLEKYGVKEIYFDDAIFTIPRAKEIAEGLLKSGVKTAWSCWMDWNIDLEAMRLLKESGCVALKFGIESADSQILKSIGKSIYIDDIRGVIKNCKEMGILAHGSFMLGLPGESRRSMHDTIELAFSLGLDSCQFSIATPLPGTQFYEMAQKEGWLIDSDWTKYESLESCVVEYPDCSRPDILHGMEEVRRKKIKQLLKNPRNVLIYIRKVYRLKGLRGFCRELLHKWKFILKSILYSKR